VGKDPEVQVPQARAPQGLPCPQGADNVVLQVSGHAQELPAVGGFRFYADKASGQLLGFRQVARTEMETGQTQEERRVIGASRELGREEGEGPGHAPPSARVAADRRASWTPGEQEGSPGVTRTVSDTTPWGLSPWSPPAAATRPGRNTTAAITAAVARRLTRIAGVACPAIPRRR
jgi:hypothetical protein